MPLFKTITQGGQVHIHQLHMLKQIFVAGLLVAFLAGGGYFAWKGSAIPSPAWRMTYEVYWAKFMIATNPEAHHKKVSQIYTPLKGKPYRRSSMSILQDPVLKKVNQHMERLLEQLAYESLKFAAWAFIATMSFWFFFGRAQQREKYQRGTTFVPWKKLKRMISRKNEDSDLKLGELPLLKNKETSHLLITGTTGSGKTNAFHILLPQIRQRKDRAIIMDVTGNYVSRYYNEKTDLLLNPLDTRSLSWNPWEDCHLDSHYDVLAESFVQTKNGAKDPFWDNASRAMLKTALRKYAFQGESDIQRLYTFLVSSSSKEFESFFKGTEAATFASQDNEKTTHSIRSVLSSQVECLRQLEPTNEAFSIRRWVMESSQRLDASQLPNFPTSHFQ